MKSICAVLHRTSGAVVCLGAILLLMTSAARAENTFIRVNQVGYELSTSGRAYLMAKGSETGASFDVEDSFGKSVFSSP